MASRTRSSWCCCILPRCSTGGRRGRFLSLPPRTTFPGSVSPKHARLEYASVDVTDQKAIWETVEKIAEEEGRLDACVAAAGMLRSADCLECPAEGFQKLVEVNVNGVLYTVQAAGWD